MTSTIIIIFGHVQGFYQQKKPHYDFRIHYGSLLNITSVGLYLPLFHAYMTVILKNIIKRRERATQMMVKHCIKCLRKNLKKKKSMGTWTTGIPNPWYTAPQILKVHDGEKVVQSSRQELVRQKDKVWDHSWSEGSFSIYLSVCANLLHFISMHYHLQKGFLSKMLLPQEAEHQPALLCLSCALSLRNT